MAAVHLCLACQRASGSTINSDLKNNIQMCCLLGQFDDAASSLMFDKDISNLSKPWIKGRGFIQSGNEIIETQTYWTQPEKDWEFDEDALVTYENPNFREQCKIRGKDFDALNTGWVKQIPLDELMDEEDKEDEDEEELDNEEMDEEDDFLPRKKDDSSKSKDEDEEEDDSWWDEEDEEDEEEEESKSEESTPPEINAIPEDIGKEFTGTTNHEKVEAAIAKADIGEKPRIKLNFDKTQGDNPKPVKKIKINLPPPKT